VVACKTPQCDCCGVVGWIYECGRLDVKGLSWVNGPSLMERGVRVSRESKQPTDFLLIK